MEGTTQQYSGKFHRQETLKENGEEVPAVDDTLTDEAYSDRV